MISVIIPVKNAENTIKQSIQSVIDQNVNDIEILCIVNGTTDNTENKIKELNDERIKIFHSSPGIVPALNLGLKESRGDLIARQDADDIWHNNKLIKQVEYLNLNQEIDILGTQLKVVDQNNNFLYNTSYPLSHDLIAKEMLSGSNSIGHPSVIFRKRILEKCAGYFDLFNLAEDFDLWMRCLPWFKLSNLSEALVTYKHVPNPTYNPNIPRSLATWYKIIYGVE
jgi:glycosyltransferase involved in cell wall biosynthesis